MYISISTIHDVPSIRQCSDEYMDATAEVSALEAFPIDFPAGWVLEAKDKPLNFRSDKMISIQEYS